MSVTENMKHTIINIMRESKKLHQMNRIFYKGTL